LPPELMILVLSATQPAPMLGLDPFGVYGRLICFAIPSAQPDTPCGTRHFGVVHFAGGVPVYDCTSHKLLGGAGASGDSVDADDLVTRKAISLASFCASPNQIKP
jgi:hypothetical protein